MFCVVFSLPTIFSGCILTWRSLSYLICSWYLPKTWNSSCRIVLMVLFLGESFTSCAANAPWWRPTQKKLLSNLWTSTHTWLYRHSHVHTYIICIRAWVHANLTKSNFHYVKNLNSACMCDIEHVQNCAVNMHSLFIMFLKISYILRCS